MSHKLDKCTSIIFKKIKITYSYDISLRMDDVPLQYQTKQTLISYMFN